MSEDGGQMTDVRNQKSEVRDQRAEVRGQKDGRTEDGRQRAE